MFLLSFLFFVGFCFVLLSFCLCHFIFYFLCFFCFDFAFCFLFLLVSFLLFVFLFLCFLLFWFLCVFQVFCLLMFLLYVLFFLCLSVCFLPTPPFYLATPCGLWGHGSPARSQAWEHQVLATGPPENFWPQGILISVSSPQGPHLSTKTQLTPNSLQALVLLDASGQTTSKTGTQDYPSADRLPKVVLSSQTHQNTPLDTTRQTRDTRASSTHQSAGASPYHQAAYASPWTNFTQQGADTRSKRNYNTAACGKETTKTVS